MNTPDEEFSNVVAMIYEAAFKPEVWPQALGALCALSNSASGSMVVLNGDETPRFTGIGPVVDVLQHLSANCTWRNSYSVSHIQEVPNPVFTYDADFFTPEMLEGDPLRRPVLRAHGLGGQSATVIRMMGGESVLVTFEHGVNAARPSDRDLKRLTLFRPHLARAAILATKLRLRGAETAAQSFAELGFPAAVVDRRGSCLAVSTLLESRPDLFDLLVNGRLAAANPRAAELLARAVGETTHGKVVRSLPIMVRDDTVSERALVLHVLPLLRAAQDIFGSGAALVVATFADPSQSAPAPAVLSNLFDLTAAESRLAVALAKGMSLKGAGTECGITFGSARAYLERIFRKTGANRQGQLVAILKSAQPFRPST